MCKTRFLVRRISDGRKRHARFAREPTRRIVRPFGLFFAKYRGGDCDGDGRTPLSRGGLFVLIRGLRGPAARETTFPRDR